MSDLPTRILAEIDRIEQHAAALQGVRQLPLLQLTTDGQISPNQARATRALTENSLRGCAADRRIIGRHKLATRYVWDPVLDDDREVEYCKPCTMGNGCSCCIFDNDYEPWPCATLRDLADGYDIPVDVEPTKAAS